MRKLTQKRENRSTNWDFRTFFENRKRTKKKLGNGPNKEETDQQTENLKLFLKTGNGPKNEETDPKAEETDQQTENLKVIKKTNLQYD